MRLRLARDELPTVSEPRAATPATCSGLCARPQAAAAKVHRALALCALDDLRRGPQPRIARDRGQRAGLSLILRVRLAARHRAERGRLGLARLAERPLDANLRVPDEHDVFELERVVRLPVPE